jgi:hypothetical protein
MPLSQPDKRGFRLGNPAIGIGKGPFRLSLGGGGEPAADPTLIIITLHQSNMNGGQTTGSPTLVSPADDAQTGLDQWSPNGGGAYLSGGVEPNPSFARTLIPASGGGLRFSTALNPNTVGPAYSFMKAAAILTGNPNIIVIPAGVGGTDTNEWLTGSGPPTNWPANRYTVAKTAYDTLKVAVPDSTIYAFVASILENEIANNRAGVGASQAVVDAYMHPLLDSWVAGFRAFGGPGADTAPFLLSTPVPEWLGYGNNQARRYLLSAAKWAAATPNVGLIRRPLGYATGGDPIHQTNIGNRIHGPELSDFRPVVIALQTAAASVPTTSLNGETLSITSVGASLYEIWTRAPAGSGDYTKYDYISREHNKVGSTMKLTLPMQGGRDAIVVAKNAAGGDSQATPTSASTPHVTYAVPAVTPPTPVVSIDVDNASLDGSLNIISVPSNGSDTTAWTPTAAAGQGATAALKRVLVGSKYGLVLDSASKSLWRGSAYVFPAGDISFVMPLLFSTVPASGVFIGCAQTGTAMDMFASANSGAGFKWGFNSNSVQVGGSTTFLQNSTDSVFYRFFCGIYNRTANTVLLYCDDELVASGTPTQRSASPANSGGTRFFNSGIDTATAGWSGGTIALPPKVYNAVLTFDEMQKIKNDYRTDHGVTFGYTPV